MQANHRAAPPGRKAKPNTLAVLGAIAALASALGAASAPGRLPAELAVPRYQPALSVGHFHHLDYRVSWIGIPAAAATLELGRNPRAPDLRTGEARVSTNRLVDLFFRMRDYLREDFTGRSLAPREIYIRQHENRRLNEYNLRFDRASSLVTVVKRNNKGNETRLFRSENPAGPISGAMMALAQPLRLGDRLVFDVFVGRRRYVLELTVAGRERVRVPLGVFDALRIVPKILYSSDEDWRHRTRDPAIWVSADPRHIPLRVEAGLFIGRVRIDLIEMDVSDHAAGRVP